MLDFAVSRFKSGTSNISIDANAIQPEKHAMMCDHPCCGRHTTKCIRKLIVTNKKKKAQLKKRIVKEPHYVYY